MNQNPDQPESDEEGPLWILDPDSWWVRLFGPFAAMARFFVAWALAMSVFLLAVRVPSWLSRKLDTTSVTESRVTPDTTPSSSLEQLESQLAGIHEKIDQELAESEEILRKRKMQLARIREDAESLQLTPTQRALIGNTARAHPKLTFYEWISDRNVYYGIAINFVMSAAFFLLGLRSPRRRRKLAT